MTIKRLQKSLVFNTVLCWIMILSTSCPSAHAQGGSCESNPIQIYPEEEFRGYCDYVHEYDDEGNYALNEDGYPIMTWTCYTGGGGGGSDDSNAGSTNNQNSDDNSSQTNIDYSNGSSNSDFTNSTDSNSSFSSYCASCASGDVFSSSIWQDNLSTSGITTESALLPPSDPLLLTPPQAFSAPNYTASPWLVQAISLGDDFWGVPMGNLVVAADPNSTEPLHISDVKVVLKRAAGILDLGMSPLGAGGIDSNNDGIDEYQQVRYSTSTAFFLVQSGFAGSGELRVMGYDLSATVTHPDTGDLVLTQGAVEFLNLTFSRSLVNGQPGITISGFQSDGTSTENVALSYVAHHAPGSGASRTIIENGSKTVVTDSFDNTDAEDDADGWHHVEDTVVSKAGTTPGSWIESMHVVRIYRTLFNGREVLIEQTTAAAGGATNTVRYQYEEEIAYGGVRNKAFSKLRTKIVEDGTWEAYEYDVTTGMLYRTYKPWMDSPPPPLSQPLANYSSSCKVERIFHDPANNYLDSYKTITVMNGTLSQQSTSYVQDTDYMDAQHNEKWTRYVSDTESEQSFTSTVFLRDPDGYTRTIATTGAQNIVTVYEEQRGSFSAAEQTFTPDPTGTYTASIRISPTANGNDRDSALAGRTRRNVTVRQVNGSPVLSYTEIATVDGLFADAQFQRIEGRYYTYDSEYRLSGVYMLDSTPVQTHEYTATSHTVTDAEGVATVTELDELTGEELAVIRKPASATVGGVTHQSPELRDTMTVVRNPVSGLVTNTQIRVGTQEGQSAITAAFSTTRTPFGRVSSKTDQAGRVTTYQYNPDARTSAEILPGGLTNVRRFYLDGQLKSKVGTAGVAEFYQYYAVGYGQKLVITSYQNADQPAVQRNTVQTYPAGQVLSETVSTRNPVTGQIQAASGYSADYDGYGRLYSRQSVSGVIEYNFYNQWGEQIQSGTDADGISGLQSYASDVVTLNQSETLQENGAWWEKTTSRRLSKNGDANAALTTTTWRKLGTGSASYTRTVQPDGTEVVMSTSIDRTHAARTVTQTLTRPGGTPLVSTQLYVNGLLMAETQPGVTGAITHTYDGLERRVSTTDPRTGTVQWNYLPDGRLNWTKDAGNRQTNYAYYPVNGPQVGRLQAITHPDNTTTTYQYDAQGRITLQAGSSGYPVAYEYDAWGKMKKMKTWRDPQGVPDVTTWVNDPVLGVLEKTDAAGETVRYSYYPGGALKSRTWARGVITTYGYDNAGRLTSVDYSDATPDVSTSYDRLSRPVTISDGSGSRTQTYDETTGAWDALNYAAGGTLGAISVQRGFDLQFREDELQVVQAGQIIASTGFSYHEPTGRIASISHGGSTATYDWSSTVAGLPVGISYSGAGLTGRRTPDAEGRLDKIDWSIGQENVLSHDYTLDSRGRRTAAAREDGTHWDYGYNDRGEVTSAAQERADDTLLPGRGFGYAFDAIGNRTQASVTFATPPPVQATTYTPNALNQYTSISRTNPLRRVLQGIAHPGATIEVKMDSPTGQNRTVARVEPNGAGFIAEAEADTALAAVWRQVVVEASLPGVGVNGATVKTKRTGWLFFPPQNETLVYDQDGNLKEDARWLYTWDGENRLTAMEEKQIANSSLGQTPPPRQRLEFAYDSQSRRVRKVVKVLQNQTWSVTSDLRFVYDAWNLLAEFSMKPGTSNLELLRSYAWGYDLSSTEQGAGGVGGLVLVKQLSTTVNNGQPSQTGALAPCYDGNGNILAYLDCATGKVTQRMEYDAFGVEMTLESVLDGGSGTIREVPFRFSTKYADAETSLSYYGFRYYSPELGRWLNRDPIGEDGGINLYGMVGNDAVNKWDRLGLYAGVTIRRYTGGMGHQFLHFPNGLNAGFYGTGAMGTEGNFEDENDMSDRTPNRPSPDDADYYYEWDTEKKNSGKLGAGTKEGCPCKNLSEGDILDCLGNFMDDTNNSDIKFNIATRNCRVMSERAVKTCCMKKGGLIHQPPTGARSGAGRSSNDAEGVSQATGSGSSSGR